MHAIRDTVLDPAPTLPTLTELEAATTVVRAVVPPTPQYRWPLLCDHLGAEVWIKHENHTPVGAFKLRGGLVYMDHLRRQSPAVLGVVSATRGNHGQSIALAASRVGLLAAIVVPRGNSREKNQAMQALGAELIEEGDDFQAAIEASCRIAQERGWHRIPSFHPALVAGVGTYALELFRAVPDLDRVYVPIGLGSGACGVLAARDALGLRTKVIGVVSSGAPAYARSFAAGQPVSHPVTTRLADGMACRTPDPSAFALLRRGLDHVVEVSDDEVAEAMRLIFTATHTVAEGAGAAALAAALQEREALAATRTALILSGGNVDRELFTEVLRGEG
jgi:threonine dehydratase